MSLIIVGSIMLGLALWAALIAVDTREAFDRMWAGLTFALGLIIILYPFARVS